MTTVMKARVRIWIVGLLCLAPVPGDIGSCGQAPDALDARRFFEAKKTIDCIRCEECGLSSDACNEACVRRAATPVRFAERCAPVVHDGEVCLRKLLEASCGDYVAYVRDESPEVPSECNFCPRGGP